jgi:hypothetical protein
VDLAVSQDQQDVVNLILKSGLHILKNLLKDGSEEGRTVESDELKLLAVLGNNALSSNDLGVRVVAVEREAVADIV